MRSGRSLVVSEDDEVVLGGLLLGRQDHRIAEVADALVAHERDERQPAVGRHLELVATILERGLRDRGDGRPVEGEQRDLEAVRDAGAGRPGRDRTGDAALRRLRRCAGHRDRCCRECGDEEHGGGPHHPGQTT